MAGDPFGRGAATSSGGKDPFGRTGKPSKHGHGGVLGVLERGGSDLYHAAVDAPAGLKYQHHQTGEDNADAHLKRTLMGHQVMLPITAGKLDLGPWEQVFYAEFDGQRKKRGVVKVMGE